MAGKDERRAALEAELAALDADDDDDDEVTIRRGDDSFTGSWRRAVQVAKTWGYSLIPVDVDQPAESGTDAKGGKGKGGTAEVRRFAGRRIG